VVSGNSYFRMFVSLLKKGGGDISVLDSQWTHTLMQFAQARAQYPFADPYFGGIVAAYGAQAVVSTGSNLD
jgi:hypothetical protein